jgi:5-methylcytosine-specific restriction endonuclease McrA
MAETRGYKRIPIKKEDQLTVWLRDSWGCRYCGDPVFFSPALKLLDDMNPGHGYYHVHGNRNHMIRLFLHKWASVDHVMPVTHGGQNTLENYVTACWQCNMRLSNTLDGRAIPIPVNPDLAANKWDGLIGIYLHLSPETVWTRLLRKMKAVS